MIEDSKLIPRTPGSNGAVDVLPASARVPSIDLSPREPHLYDYLLILRKHQWLILSFLLTVVTIVSIATLLTPSDIFNIKASSGMPIENAPAIAAIASE